MSDWPRSNAELLYRLMRPETEATALRLRMLARHMPGAPPGEVHRFGRCTALVCPALPQLGFYNTVHGLAEEHLPQLDAILAVYEPHGIKPNVLAWPGLVGRGVALGLAERGLAAVGWCSLLYRPTGERLPESEDVTVREMGRTPEEGLLFAELFCRGFGMPDEDRERATPSIADWLTIDACRAFCAEVDGTPIGFGLLEIEDGVGYLAAAATLEEHRGKGAQGAVIRRRINEATTAGCDIVCVQTGYATQSQANQERYGFRLAATAAYWSQRPDPA